MTVDQNMFMPLHLAKVIVPNRKHQIIGMRPGEKIAEVLITKDESKNTIEFGKYYVIYSEVFPKINKKGNKSKIFEYNSTTNTNFLSIKNQISHKSKKKFMKK